MAAFAVVDLETTGLSPAHHHRVLEIGVALVNDNGRVEAEWDSLVNPERDIGAEDIHGLRASELYRAPTFAQIAGELLSLLRGRVVVAHNLSFEALFLNSEFGRIGVSIPLSPTTGLCTMRLAGHYLPSRPRSLEACCACIGYTIEHGHAALPDARATAALLSHYIEAGHLLESWEDLILTAQGVSWPDIPPTKSRLPRAQASAVLEEHFLGRLASRAPRVEAHPQANSYLGLLDRVLLDRRVSHHEQDELVATASLMGLSREDAVRLHRAYLSALARLALDDGQVSADERANLGVVASLLGLADADVDAALGTKVCDEAKACEVGSFALCAGDTIVFTGEVVGMSRSELEYQAKCLGLRVTGTVSAKTRLLVAADPDSLSGKARRARDLGVPIVAPDAYLSLLGSLERRSA